VFPCRAAYRRRGTASRRLRPPTAATPGPARTTALGRPRFARRTPGVLTTCRLTRRRAAGHDHVQPGGDRALEEAGRLGDLTGDKDLKREGKVDEASGTIKDKVADVADAVKDRLHKDQLSRPSAIVGISSGGLARLSSQVAHGACGTHGP
jgi:hypothetical protein